MPVSASHSFVHFYSTVLQVVSDAWLYLVFQNPCPEILTYGSMSSLTRGSSKPHVLMHSEQAGKIACAVSNLLKLGHNATRSAWLPGLERRGQKGARLSQVIGSVDSYAPLFALRIHFFIKSHWRAGWSEGASGCSSMYSTCTSIYLSHPGLSDLELICLFKTLRLCPSVYIKQHLAMFLGTWVQCLYSFRAVPGLLCRLSNNSWAQFRSWV